MNPAKWSVRRVPTSVAERPGYGVLRYRPWFVQPPFPTDQFRAFATWREAFDFADEMSRGLA